MSATLIPDRTFADLSNSADLAHSIDLQSRAQASLQTSRYSEVQKTTCKCHHGVLYLQGEVTSFYLKQIAQTMLMNVPGVTHIINTIHVQPTHTRRNDRTS